MALRVVRLGMPREDDEGLRLGTVRRPPRGVAKAQIAARDFYDVWLPELAPSADSIAWLKAQAPSESAWRSFARRYRAEMKAPAAARLLDLLAAMSQRTSLSVGCYCEDEARCHRSLLRELLGEHGAALSPARSQGER